jgi:hypothetical protein
VGVRLLPSKVDPIVKTPKVPFLKCSSPWYENGC